MKYTAIESVIETYKHLTAKSENALNKRIISEAKAQYTELRRLVAVLTTEPLHITRADIDAAKRILKAEEE